MDFKRRFFSAPIMALVFLISAPARPAAPEGREFFVSIRGEDANSGRTRGEAFATIGRGISVLEPGDTLTILPGEYFESVTTSLSGTPEAPVTIRASRPGSVLMRGDVDLSGFRRHEDSLYTWVADFDLTVQGVGEPATGLQYVYVPSREEVDFVRASWFHDTAAARLYVNVSDTSSPDERRLVAGVTEPVRNGGFGLLFTGASDVVVDGLAFSGYHSFEPALPPGNSTRWGMFFVTPKRVTVRNCVAFLNGGGIGMARPVSSVIEDCLAFGNGSPHNGSGGNIIAWTPASDTVLRRNRAHSTFTNGIRFYGSGTENCRVEDNIAWDCAYGEIWIKGGDNSTSRMTGNATPGFLHAGNSVVRGNTLFMGSGSGLDDDGSNLFMGVDLDPYAHFVSPDHRDYRLQGDSSLRGSGPGGSDPGAYTYREEVFFVSPDGDDRARGTSVHEAWRTLEQAFSAAGPGDTVYFLPGVYQARHPRPARSGVEGRPIRFRGRGHGVVIEAATPGDAALRLGGRSRIEFEDMEFRGPVNADESKHVTFSRCSIAGVFTAVDAVSPALRNSHAEKVVVLRARGAEVSGVRFLSGPEDEACLGIDAVAADSLWSERNAFPAGRPAAAHAGRGAFDLAGWRAVSGQDTHSYEANESGDVAALPGRGPLGTAIGREGAVVAEEELVIENIRVHSVTATTANIEWWTPSRETVGALEWGTTPECGERVEDIFETGSFHTVSLAGLEPGRTYYFRAVAWHPPWEIHANEELAREQIEMDRPTVTGPVLTFETAAVDVPPRTYHVSPDGDDDADGVSRENAWRRVGRAADAVRAGDTVLIHEGRYEEFVVVRATGDIGLPVTFQAAPGARVWMEGSARNRPQAFLLSHKHHVVLDGLFFRDFRQKSYHAAAEGGAVRITGGSRNTIRRCFYDGRGRGYMPYFLFATSSSDLLVENSVVIQGWLNSVFWHCPDLVLRNNAFYLGQIRSIHVWNEPDQVFTLSHNLFCDLIPNKAGNTILGFWDARAYRGDNNIFFSRRPEEERRLFSHFRPERQVHTFPEMRGAWGQDARSGMINPGIRAVTEMMDYKRVTAEYRERELHYRGSAIRPLGFEDFFVDPDSSASHAEPGRVVGPDPAAFRP